MNTAIRLAALANVVMLIATSPVDVQTPTDVVDTGAPPCRDARVGPLEHTIAFDATDLVAFDLVLTDEIAIETLILDLFMQNGGDQSCVTELYMGPLGAADSDLEVIRTLEIPGGKSASAEVSEPTGRDESGLRVGFVSCPGMTTDLSLGAHVCTIDRIPEDVDLLLVSE